jgi:hypothetical protein
VSEYTVDEKSPDNKNFHDTVDFYLKELKAEINDDGDAQIRDHFAAYQKASKEFMTYCNDFFNNLQNRNHIQIAAYQAHITAYSNQTDNFIQFLNSLKPQIADSVLLKSVNKIGSEVSYLKTKTDYLTDNVSSIGTDVTGIKHSIVTAKQVSELRDELKKDVSNVDKKTEDILTLLQPQKSPTGIIGVNLFEDNIIGANYYFVIERTKDNIGHYLGVEAIIPIGSTTIKNTGAFLLYGIEHDHLLLSAGAGYLQTSSQQNISWKIDGTYFIGHEGIGINYSPLTNVGLQLSFRWR